MLFKYWQTEILQKSFLPVINQLAYWRVFCEFDVLLNYEGTIQNTSVLTFGEKEPVEKTNNSWFLYGTADKTHGLGNKRGFCVKEERNFSLYNK